MKGYTSVRRSAARQGSAKVAFLLGICAGIAFLIVIRDKIAGGLPPGRRLPIDIALSPNEAEPSEGRPPDWVRDPPTKPYRRINDNDSGKWRMTSKLKLDVDVSPPPPDREGPKPEPIVEKVYDPTVHNRAAYDKEEEEDEEEEDDDEEASPPEPDHIVSVTKYQYYVAKQFSLGFQDLPGSYYLEVVLSSSQPRRWGMSEDEWYALKGRIKAVSRGGGRYRCAHMWPVSIPGEGRIEIWMVFKVRNGARIKGILLDKKRLPIAEVVDSGE